MSEDAIHKSVMAWLRLVLPDAMVVHVPNGGARSKVAAAKIAALGVVPGWPDLTIVLPGGRVVCLEVKARLGRISPAQASVRQRLGALGVPVGVVRSIDDARLFLHRCSVETREVVA